MDWKTLGIADSVGTASFGNHAVDVFKVQQLVGI